MMKNNTTFSDTEIKLREIAESLGVSYDDIPPLDPIEIEPIEEIRLEEILPLSTDWDDWETRINSGI